MFIFLIAALLATILTPIVIKVYTSQHWVEDPLKRQHLKVTHQTVVPRGGGLVIFFAVALPALFLLHVNSYLLSILAGALLLTIVGFIDDIFDIHPFVRLVTGGIAALIVVGSGIGIPYVTNPFGPGLIHLDQPQIPFMLFVVTHH